MNKKLISLFLCAVVAVSVVLAACGGGSNGGTNEPAQGSANANAGGTEYAYTTNDGIEIDMHAAAEPILSKLGEAMNYTEEASCAFEGLDKTYFYGSFYLTTYPKEDKDFVSMVELVDDTVKTKEGVSIGDSQSKVEEVYGVEDFNGVNAYIMEGDNSSLTIIVDGGKVSSIQYSALFE